ncbi:MAG: nucleoside deaminase [Clostridiales bacterium]|jgi:tRNA(adenine34) deaminase|nr:nucleoside deaminase [Clostridiales bacterium]
MRDKFFMSLALAEARAAAAAGETPIGCAIAFRGQLIALGRNTRNAAKNALGHAEIAAIGAACAFMGDWRLEGCELFVTAEPCPMCAGAIIQARIPRVVFGAANKKAGCAGSVINILDCPGFNHRCAVAGGVLESECSALMTGFFTDFRRRASLQAPR